MHLNWIAREHIEDGMVLGLPLEDEMGRVLLHRGASLQRSYRERLEAWGIDEVAIEIVDDGLPVPPIDRAPIADSPELDSLSDSQLIKLTDVRLQRRFGPHEGDPLMDVVARVARRKLVRNRTRSTRRRRSQVIKRPQP